MSVSTTVKTIQDIMRKDAGVDGDAQRINQLVWMFFLKIFDDRESEKELLEDGYRSPMPERLRWRNWAADAEGSASCRLRAPRADEAAAAAVGRSPLSQLKTRLQKRERSLVSLL